MSETVWAGRFIAVETEGNWEYAVRPRGIAAAVILAIDDGSAGDAGNRHVLLVEQYRVPIARRCLELPAGLVGDETAGEAIGTAAARELEEETGYRADRIESLGLFCSSPGMTSEAFTLIRATGLTRVAAGGGVDGEDIAVHRVPLAAIGTFVAERRAAGVAVDAKVLLLLAGGIV